ncbi:MAG: hypothetical protein ACPHJ3_16070, partial [Rubripirellula sp.]
MSQDQSPQSHLSQRRRFLNLGLATIASGVLASRNVETGAKQTPAPGDKSATDARPVMDSPRQGIDIEKWRKLKSEPYEFG